MDQRSGTSTFSFDSTESPAVSVLARSAGRASTDLLATWPSETSSFDDGAEQHPLPTLRILDIDGCAQAIGNLGKLSHREIVVLGYLLRAMENEAIAEHTGLSKRGVKFHVCNILRKLRITHRNELIKFFF